MTTRGKIWFALWSVATAFGGADSLDAQTRQAAYLPPAALASRPFVAEAKQPNEMRAPNAANQIGRREKLAMRSQPPRSNIFAAQLRRLPPVASQRLQNATNAPEVDGTWRDNGRHIIINLNGQQLRLEKSGEAPAPSAHAPPTGEVYGRLSHKGRPVVDCKIALLPLKKSWNGYYVDGSVEPTIGSTDNDGVYRIEGVASGPYKLTWLPKGERQWIRRIQIRPDVHVRADDIAHVKEIRKSLRTVN